MIFLLWAIFHLATAHQDLNERQMKEEYINTIQDLVKKVASLEEKMEVKNEQIGHLEKHVKELETWREKEMRMQCKADAKKELDDILPTAIQQGLRDLPFEMVCAFRYEWTDQAEDAVVTYDRITLEFNNSDRPGGADVKLYSLFKCVSDSLYTYHVQVLMGQ